MSGHVLTILGHSDSTTKFFIFWLKKPTLHPPPHCQLLPTFLGQRPHLNFFCFCWSIKICTERKLSMKWNVSQGKELFKRGIHLVSFITAVSVYVAGPWQLLYCSWLLSKPGQKGLKHCMIVTYIRKIMHSDLCDWCVFWGDNTFF